MYALYSHPRSHSSFCNLTPAISRVLIGRHLIFCAHPYNQRAVTRLENVRQLNIRWGKKLGFQLSHRQPQIFQVQAKISTGSILSINQNIINIIYLAGKARVASFYCSKLLDLDINYSPVWVYTYQCISVLAKNNKQTNHHEFHSINTR